jgi:hypothetical protein
MSCRKITFIYGIEKCGIFGTLFEATPDTENYRPGNERRRQEYHHRATHSVLLAYRSFHAARAEVTLAVILAC